MDGIQGLYINYTNMHTTLILITGEVIHYSNSSEAVHYYLWLGFEIVIEIHHPLHSYWFDSAQLEIDSTTGVSSFRFISHTNHGIGVGGTP